MNQKPILFTTKSGLVIMPQAFRQLLAYTRYYIYESKQKLAEYHETITQLHSQGLARSSEKDAAVSEAQQELTRAQQVERELERLQGEMQRIYTWDFEKLAEVFRQTRIFLEQKNILDVFTIKVVLDYLVAMLKAENPKFSSEKFIEYINEGGWVSHGNHSDTA